MKFLNPVLVLISVIALPFLACNKSDNKQKTKTDLLTQSAWKFDNAKVGGIDVSLLIEACQKDNIITFVSDKTGTLDEGTLKCNANDPQTTSFTWDLTSNETVLHITAVLFTGGSSDFTIVSLSDTQLVLSQVITVSGQAQTAVVTFKH